MYLYHYYDKRTGPFRNLSDLTLGQADEILTEIKLNQPNSMMAKRDLEYMNRRLGYENLVREIFISKGGKLQRNSPHYMVIGYSEFLYSWYEEQAYIKIPIEEFDLETLSFTYGDMHPTFSPMVTDGREYRKKLYNYEEIIEVIDRYGMPQDWNGDGRFGPERYIEVQVWSDATIKKYL